MTGVVYIIKYFFTVLPNEMPTLLHFAAYYDLKKLAKVLLKCPGAKEALSIKNCYGNGPVGVAKLRKNEEMEQLLQDPKVSVIPLKNMVWCAMALYCIVKIFDCVFCFSQANENINSEDEYEYAYAYQERCYESHIKMSGKNPQYVFLDPGTERSQSFVNDGEELYDNKSGVKSECKSLCCIFEKYIWS